MATLTYFTVVADFLAIVGDTATDVDANPDLLPISGAVRFTPSIKSGDLLVATTLSPRPSLLMPARITADIASDGQLKYNGNVGVRQVVNSAVLGLTTPLSYSVSFSVRMDNDPAPPSPFTFVAPSSDVVINLLDVAPPPKNT